MGWPWRRRRRLVFMSPAEQLFWSRMAARLAMAIGIALGLALLAWLS
jgi:hypothetical protein